MLPVQETPSFKDFVLTLGLAFLLVGAGVLFAHLFPALKFAGFETFVSGLAVLVAGYPAARKLGFRFGKTGLYLAGLKSELRTAFKYFLVIMALYLGINCVYSMALAPWDLGWTNTLLFWNDQSSNPATLSASISGLLANPLLIPGYVLSICALSPVLEEFVLRRWLYAAMRVRLPVAAAILLNGALFGLLHGKDFFGTAVFGFFFCWAYERTGKLATPILIHAFVNLSALLEAFGSRTFGF